MNYIAILFIPVLLSNIWFSALRLAQPPANLKPKIFVIGLSRTGTTSIGNALSLLGYKRLGWKDLRSPHLVQTYIHGDLEPLIQQTQYFDAFEDLPWPYIYPKLVEMYPDAKFILSLRKDERTWLRSMRRHLGRGQWDPWAHFYGVKQIELDDEVDVVLRRYRAHTDSVRSFFRGMPERYWELVIDGGDANWAFLCRIAECPNGVPAVDFPKSNTAAEWSKFTLFGFLHDIWGTVLRRVEDLSTDFYYKRDVPVVRRGLDAVWHVVSTLELAGSELYFRYVVQRQRPLPVVQSEIPITLGRDD